MVVADRELQTEREAREHVERALAACKDKLAGAALGPASPSRLQARVLVLEEALAAAQRCQPRTAHDATGNPGVCRLM
jgi:hypothetical protein